MIKSEYNINACNAQRFLFSTVAEQGYDLEHFANQYLTSDFCAKDVDDWRGRFHQELFLKVILGACNKEIKVEPQKRCIQNPGGIGYMYRLLCEITGLPSKKIIQEIPFCKMELYCNDLDEKTYEGLADELLADDAALLTDFDERINE